MALTTYTELKDSIAEWLNRSDLTAVIPTFIALAESNLNRSLRVRQMVKRLEDTVDEGFYTLPADFLEAKNVQITVSGRPQKLELITLGQADDVNMRTLSGTPKYFNITGNTLEIVPTTASFEDIEITSYGKIPALSATVTSNWLLAAWPDIYLYGALSHSAPYLKDDERTVVWSSIYDRAREEIRLADEKTAYAGGVLKMRTPSNF